MVDTVAFSSDQFIRTAWIEARFREFLNSELFKNIDGIATEVNQVDFRVRVTIKRKRDGEKMYFYLDGISLTNQAQPIKFLDDQGKAKFVLFLQG